LQEIKKESKNLTKLMTGTNKKNLTHLTKTELEEELAKLGEKPFRAKQIWNWIYARGVKSFSEMSNISKELREKLEENFSLTRPEISKDIISFDGTRKFLVKFLDGREIETVFIPEEARGTLCISSQVGCTLSCKFCHTGTQTLVRNLEFHEIVAQILVAKDLLDDWKKNNSGENHKLTHIVFMGMGEPFFNYENVAKSVKILNDQDGLNLSARKITISTSGLVPEILRAANELKTNLAISLHATNDALRTDIMAINKKYPLKDLLTACKTYNRLNPNEKITFEYVMLKGVNDQEENARELINLIKKFNLNVKINLIPFNPWNGCEYDRSALATIEKFQKILKDAKVISPIRKTRGDDVLAACGQLKSESMREKKKKN
jgi:23S rRNA (adenine2503-C2)-methyltransferase